MKEEIAAAQTHTKTQQERNILAIKHMITLSFIVLPILKSQLQRLLCKLILSSFRIVHLPTRIYLYSETHNKIERGIQRDRPVYLRNKITRWNKTPPKQF